MAFPSPPAPRTATLAQRPAPGRVAVFFQVLLRSIVIAVGGGVVIAVGYVVVAWLAGESFVGFDGAISTGTEDMVAVVFIAGFIGAAVGLGLGVTTGVFLGVLASLVLVPSRGPTVTHWVMRVSASLCVAGFFDTFFSDGGRLWLVFAGAGAAGAVVLAPWLMGWYLRRAQPTPDG